MYKLNFHHPIHVHFIGIGGISMSGLAEILAEEGFTISGSDSKESDLTRHLSEKGIQIYYGQCADNIQDGIDLVVYTAAIREDNPEWQAAKQKQIPMLTRAELLGQIMDNYEQSIAVAGTHGKTTTTSMISQILLAADADPTISVGGILEALGGNLRVGGSETFLTEACEYTNSFLNFRPKYSIILNVEAEHLDFFKDLADVRHSFRLFAENTKSDGALIINGAIDNYEEISGGLSCNVVTFGLDAKNDFSASDISFDEKGCAGFTVMYRGKSLGTLKLRVPGIHNVANALAAVACCTQAGISFDRMQEGLLAFHGADRRFQYKGTIDGITIIDDYAHHPTEIRATLTAAANYPHKRLVLVFQPHTYSRTKAFLDDFADVLSLADVVVLADIYAAREKNTIGISSRDILDKLKAHGTECYYFPSFEEIEKFLLENCINGDLLITMGAGNVVEIGEALLGK
ncbi:MAG: UDP-N-acetylmuramate--L-alanine ligase [Agathobacter sp.]|nr:UDP-N-acetylmuramate--L-alanine ligase [Agathobacter sp.]